MAKKNTDEKHDEMPDIVRSSAGLRDAMFDELDSIRNGKSNPNRLIAVSKIACQIINSVKMEIEYNKHVASSKTNERDFLTGSNLRLSAQ